MNQLRILNIKIAFAIIFFSFNSCNSELKKGENTKENPPRTLNQFLTKNNNYVKIQLTQLKSGHLSLSVIVNNKKGRFILDTGSSSTIIDRRHRKKFRLKTQNTKKIAKTAGGSQLKMKISLENTFQFNQLKMHNVKVSLVNLKHINYSFQKMGVFEVDGIIGADLLRKKEAIIDYANLILYLKI